MNLHSTRDIEGAIDEAARRLTAVEPRGYMATRVLPHLGRSPRRNWRAVLAITAGTAVAALAVFIASRPVAPGGTRLIGEVTPATATMQALGPPPHRFPPHSRDPARQRHAHPLRVRPWRRAILELKWNPRSRRRGAPTSGARIGRTGANRG